MTSTLLMDSLKDVSLDKDEFIGLLTKLIGESRHVQNSPRQGLVPQEGKIVQHVLNVLEPYSEKHGGPLLLQQFVYQEGRPNLKIVYKGSGSGCVGFVGSHMDVVPANPETWNRDPFCLEVEGDKLHGRGTTDCLGHVGVITLLLKALAERKPALQKSVVVLFIAGEEGGETGVGVDMVVKEGHLDALKSTGSTAYWIDSADSQPCTGTAGVLQWHLKATGRLFHSGLPHRGINSLELVSEALAILQRRFYQDYPPHPDEAPYNFATPSTMKPTQVECAKGSLNQINPWCTMSGDIRLTPFYDPIQVKERINGYVQELNDNMDTGAIPTRGPCSKYVLEGDDVDVKRGHLEMKWTDDDSGIRQMEGIACDLQSPGLQALVDAITEVKGEPAKPYAITGSLPLVRQMQKQGFDIQITGFGNSKAYHADNEYASLKEMQDAFQILLRVISICDNQQQ